MSKEYIERGAAVAEILKGTITTSDLYGMGVASGMDIAIERVNSVPAADVVLTVGALAAMVERTDIKVMSGYNGKVLCKKFDPAKHPSVADREVFCVWAEINASKSMCFGNIARPILCVYINGAKEYEEEHNG